MSSIMLHERGQRLWEAEVSLHCKRMRSMDSSKVKDRLLSETKNFITAGTASSATVSLVVSVFLTLGSNWSYVVQADAHVCSRIARKKCPDQNS